MSRPNYRVLLSFDSERKVFIARVPELPPCIGEGATRGEALLNMERELDALVQNLADSGARPPSAIDDLPPGEQLAVKVSRSLQRDLAFQAHIEGVELGQLIAELLASGLSHRQQSGRPQRRSHPNESPGNEAPRRHDQPERGNEQRGGGERGGWRGESRHQAARVQGLLEDRAGFMEYVRGLEQEGGHGPSHGMGQNRGPRPGFDNRGGGRRGPSGPSGPGGPPRGERGGRPQGGHGEQRGGQERTPAGTSDPQRGAQGPGGPSGSSPTT